MRHLRVVEKHVGPRVFRKPRNKKCVMSGRLSLIHKPSVGIALQGTSRHTAPGGRYVMPVVRRGFEDDVLEEDL